MSDHWKLSTYVDNLALVADTPVTVTRPAGYGSCLITPTGDVWVRRGGTANVPAASVVDGTGSALIPDGVPRIIDLHIEPTPPLFTQAWLTSFSIEAAAPCAVSIEWFK